MEKKEYQPSEQATSQREIERRYTKLLNDVKTKDFYKVDLSNRINCYVCSSCKHVTKTKDVDAGATPMFSNCESCGGRATSTFFNDVAPNQPHTWEWYRPSLKQVQKFKNNPAMLDHILSGGLDLRKV